MRPDFRKREEWVGEAACRSMNTNLFYPEKGKVHDEVRRTCMGCPVVDQCLEWALHHEGQGYFGGMTAQQRDRERRRQRIFLVEPQSYQPAYASARRNMRRAS